MDLLRTGSAWLQEQRRAAMTTIVTYRRGAVELSVPATVGRSDFPVVTGLGIFEHIEMRDYIISAADLAGIGEPQRGDLILDADAFGNPIRYEVCAPSATDPCWRYSDHATRLAYRIHTKDVGPEPPTTTAGETTTTEGAATTTDGG